jgi:signal transduction histidine kinase
MATERQSRGLGGRLERVFILQVTFISVAAVIGVFAAGITIENVLMKRALEQEAEYFWRERGTHPGLAAPHTRNLTGYRDDSDPQVPDELRGLAPGFHDLESVVGFSIVHVSRRDGDTLYLVFDGESVRELSLWFGLVPLAGVLVVLYLTSWIAYRATHRAVSPVEWLAREVRRLDPRAPDESVFAPERLPVSSDREVVALAEALTSLSRNINEYIERERNFTRDASHELRSPLTVIRLAADMLLSEQELDHPARNSALRIRRAATDMQELTEALLLLARESDQGLSTQTVCINDLVVEEGERARMLVEAKPVTLHVEHRCRLLVDANEKVLAVLVGNLVRNAFLYTEHGSVRITVDARGILIEDSGVGIDEGLLAAVFRPFVRGRTDGPRGHGVGLTIVARLSDRFGWPVNIESEPGVGTQVSVDFPGARVEDAD